MLRLLSDMRHHHIGAADGSIGYAEDFYFDDRWWCIRYLVVKTAWLLGRKVLVAPRAIREIDPARSEISVSLTREQIEDAPGTGTDLPVSAQEEIALRTHYGWLPYWDAYPVNPPAAALTPGLDPRSQTTELPYSRAEIDGRSGGDPHLRSVREVEGYAIAADDGEIGHVADFVADDETWLIRYLIVDMGDWLPGRQVIVAPMWASGVDWADRVVSMQIGRAEIESAPPYDPNRPIERDDEARLYAHLGRPGYWE